MLVLNTPWRFKRGAVAGWRATPIRYRALRVYFGVRYYRGVDFIVNIYEGGSPGCSRPGFLSSTSSLPPSTFLLSTPTWRSCLVLLPLPHLQLHLLLLLAISILSLLGEFPRTHVASWKIVNRAHEKNKYDKRTRINSRSEILRR